MENRMEQNKENMNTNNEHYGEKAEKQGQGKYKGKKEK